DDAFRAERLREQRLADPVVDFVCAGVSEVLALEPNLGAPALRQRARVSQRGRPADPGRELANELALELGRRKDVRDAVLEPRERGHQRLGHVAAAERPEAAVAVWQTPLQQRGQQALAFGEVGDHLFSSLRTPGCMPSIARTRAMNS